MKIVKKKVLGLALVGILSTGSVQSLVESVSLQKAKAGDVHEIGIGEPGYQTMVALKAKIQHIETSMNRNYWGIKNQATWEIYIKEARILVAQIEKVYNPPYESELDIIKNLIGDYETIIKYIARINHVEKSYEDNYHGIKNAAQWREYLNLAKEAEGKTSFRNMSREKIDDIKNRYIVIESKIKAIEDEHYRELSKVQEMLNRAKESMNLKDAENALVEANKLGTHETSTKIREEIKALIETIKNDEDKTDTASELEAEVARLVNIERQKNGLEGLIFDSALSSVARIKSQDMVDYNYLNHNSPNYGSPFDMMNRFNIRYGTAGENIASGQPTAEEVMKAWMNSPGHRSNILSRDFKKIGVGCVNRVWTQMFTD